MVWDALTNLAGRLVSKDEFEAIVAAGILMAGANGKIEQNEIAELKDALAEQDSVKSYAEHFHATIMDYKDRLGTNRGMSFLRKQLRDIAGKKLDVRENVFGIALDVAGTLDDDEIKMAYEIAGELDVDTKKFKKLPALPA